MVSKLEQEFERTWGAMYDLISSEREKFAHTTTNHAWLTMSLTKMHEVRHWLFDHLSDLEHQGASVQQVKDEMKSTETEKVNKSA